MEGAKESASDERRQFGVPLDAPAYPLSVTFASDSVLPAAMPRRPNIVASALHAAPVSIRTAFETEQAYGNAFLFIPVCLAIGALAYFALPHEPGFLPLLSGCAILAALAIFAMGFPAWRGLLLAMLMTALGMAAAKFETWRTATPMLGSEITTVLAGRVVRVEYMASGRTRLTLDVLATKRPTLRYAPERVRVTARSVPDGTASGSVVEGVVRLLPPSGPLRPHSYDFAFNSYFSGIGANGFFLSNVQRVEDAEPPGAVSRAAAWLERWRMAMADRIEGHIGGAEGAIAAALITGIRAGIPEEINEALRIVGLYHVISISGLHMALVGGTVMVTLRAGFALAPSFSARHPVKKYAAAAALAATTFYLLMSGADIAAQRSYLMLGVMLLAVLCDRAALTMRNLAISAIIILAVSPHEVLGPSFQMSFAATAALVAAYAGWTQWRGARRTAKPPQGGMLLGATRHAVKYAGGMSMTSVVAGLATALFTAWHFQQVSPMGLAANLAAMPFVSVLVMPMAVLASLLMPLGLEGPPLYVMGQGIAAMNAIAIWLAERSAFDATGAIPLSAVLTLTAALAILTMAGTRLRWAAAPLLLAGTFLLFTRDLPDVLVAEDGTLMGLRLEDGRLAVNRARPRAFTVQNWQRAFDVSTVLPPRRVDDPLAAARDGPGFACSDTLCVARHGEGFVAHAANADAAAFVCRHASLIVIDDATATSPCEAGVTVITKRDLARRGTAEIHLLSEKAARYRLSSTQAAASSIQQEPATLEAAQTQAATLMTIIQPSAAAPMMLPETEAARLAVTTATEPAGLHERMATSPALPALAPSVPSAAPSVVPSGAKPEVSLRFSIAEPYRPWHVYRQYSRAARGMPPWQRPEKRDED